MSHLQNERKKNDKLTPLLKKLKKLKDLQFSTSDTYKMDSPPGCTSSSENELNESLDTTLDTTNTTPNTSVLRKALEFSKMRCGISNSKAENSTTPKNRRKPKKRRGKKNGSLSHIGGQIGPREVKRAKMREINLSLEPSPHVPVTRVEKRAYKKDCVKRPKIAAPSNTTSFICDNNVSLLCLEASSDFKISGRQSR